MCMLRRGEPCSWVTPPIIHLRLETEAEREIEREGWGGVVTRSSN